MPIDFTGLYGQSVPQPRASAAKVAAPEALLRGDALPALVTRIAPVDAGMRDLLAARAALSELKLGAALTRPATSAPASPRVDARPISPLPESPARAAPVEPRQSLNALLAQPTLQLAALRIRGQTLTTLTDQPLQKGQRVLVQLNSERQLQLVSSARATPGQAPAPEVPEADRPRAAISEALRQLLPQRDRPALLPQLAAAQQALRHLPAGPGREQLQQVLQQLARVPLDASAPPRAPRADTLRQAVESSGVFLEQRLAKAVQGQRAAAEVAPLLNSDAKALLLRAVHLTRPEVLPALVTPPAPAPAAKAAPAPITAGEWQQAAEGVKTRQLPGLLQLLAQTPPASPDMRQLQIQLVVLLHQAGLANLARIRTGQLTAEPAQPRGPEGGPPQPGTLALELPVRYQGEIHPLHLRIEEEAQQEQESAPSADQQRRAWRVNLRLETPAIGEFYAQLHYLAGNLKVNFWSERTATLEEAREKFHPVSRALAAAGIAVEHVLYHQGKPAQDHNQLSYALVDIKT